MRPQNLRAPIHFLAEHRLLRVQLAAHVHILRALAGKEKDHLGLLSRGLSRRRGFGLKSAQCLHRLLRTRYHHRAPMRERLPASLQCEGDVSEEIVRKRRGKIGIGTPHPGPLPNAERGKHGRLLFEPVGEISRHGLQRGRSLRRKHEHLTGTGGDPRLRQRRFLHDHMGVGAAHAEGTYTGPAWHRGAWPFSQRGNRDKRAVLEIDARVRSLEMEQSRDLLVLQLQHGLDQAGHSGGHVEMPDMGLCRAQPAEPFSRRGLAERLSQRRHFDRVPHRGARPVRLHIADGIRSHPGGRLRQRNHCRLTLNTRCRVAHARRAVIVDRRTQNHRADMIAVRDRLRQALQNHDAGAAAKDRPAGFRIKTATSPIPRDHALRLIQIVAALGERDGDAAGQRYVALVGQQAVIGMSHCHQRSGAGCLHRHTRPPQVQLVRHPRGHEIFVVAEQGIVGAGIRCRQRRSRAGLGGNIVEQVGVETQPRVETDQTGIGFRIVTGGFQGLPCAFEKHAVLGIHQLGLPRINAEKRGVELIGVLQHRPRPHIAIGVGGIVLRQAMLQGLGRESLDCLRTLHQIAPEILQAGRTRQTRRHAHDGHSARINLRSFAHFNPPPDIGGLRKRLKA